MTDPATAMATIQSFQLLLQTIQNSLMPTAWRFPPECTIKDGASFDFIVVGGGSAGSVVASRLSENETTTVLLLEAGGYPPMESIEMPGWFVYLPRSVYDFNFTSVNDNITAQNLQGQVVGLTQGKMLGGSSSLHHMMHTQGDPADYDLWADLANDETWSYKNIQKYLKKMEDCTDKGILGSDYASLHGTDGPLKIKRETYTSNKKFLEAFAELGHKVIMDVTSTKAAVGVVESLFEIDEGSRQSAALGYLGLAKLRSNLCLSLFTTVSKVLFNNGSAYGIEAMTSSGETVKLYANKEVILAAGAINTPKLLMLSGIGPKEQLTSLGIDVIADLPVGENFQDHPGSTVVYKMGPCNTTTTSYSNPHVFPAPSFNSYVNINTSHAYADYDSINIDMQCNADSLLELSVNVFKYSYNISQKLYDITKERNVLFTFLGLVMPKSRGKVVLISKDPTVDPQIETGVLSSSEDVELIAKAFMDHSKVLNTTYFKSVNAEIEDFGLCQDAEPGIEFWKCYAVQMSATMWHYVGTCSIGKVVNSDLQVYGMKNVRVVDSSAMPTPIRGKIYAGVMMIAEKAANIIKTAWNL